MDILHILSRDCCSCDCCCSSNHIRRDRRRRHTTSRRRTKNHLPTQSQGRTHINSSRTQPTQQKVKSLNRRRKMMKAGSTGLWVADLPPEAPPASTYLYRVCVLCTDHIRLRSILHILRCLIHRIRRSRRIRHSRRRRLKKSCRRRSLQTTKKRPPRARIHRIHHRCWRRGKS